MAQKSEAGSTSLPERMVLSAFSGMGAACFCHPLDVLRVQMQVSGSAGVGMMGTASNIIAGPQGVRGLYNGLTAAFLRQWMYGSGRMGIYSQLLNNYKADNNTTSNPPLPTMLGYGCISGGIGSFIGTPSEVSIVRMSADSQLPADQRRNYKHVLDCLIRMTREEGFASLYKGATVTVLRAMSLASCTMGVTSATKQALVKDYSWDDKGLATTTVAATNASLFANAASLPFDVVKSRIQNQTGNEYKGMVDCAKKSVASEGVMVLWKGFTPAFVKLAPYTVLSLAFLEKLSFWYTGKAAL